VESLENQTQVFHPSHRPGTKTETPDGRGTIIFGLNGFFNFIPPPTTPLPEKAAAFAGALANTSYMMQLIGATQLITEFPGGAKQLKSL
jgi:hypothetical protein